MVDFKMQSVREMPRQQATVIGISDDTDARSLDRPRGVAYFPFTQHDATQMMLVARMSTMPEGVVASLRDAVSQSDGQLTITRAETGTAVAGESIAPVRLLAVASGLLGSLALLVCLVGLYGVLSFLVVRRTPELGVRMVLGADASHVLRLVLTDGLKPVGWGLAIGSVLLVPTLLNPVFARLLTPQTLVTAAMAPLLLLAAAALAAYWPARRASQVDPNVALRSL
jgi:ABC-type antimicrobial peptide transport system permease subunit